MVRSSYLVLSSHPSPTVAQFSGFAPSLRLAWWSKVCQAEKSTSTVVIHASPLAALETIPSSLWLNRLQRAGSERDHERYVSQCHSFYLRFIGFRSATSCSNPSITWGDTTSSVIPALNRPHHQRLVCIYAAGGLVDSECHGLTMRGLELSCQIRWPCIISRIKVADYVCCFNGFEVGLDISCVNYDKKCNLVILKIKRQLNLP